MDRTNQLEWDGWVFGWMKWDGNGNSWMGLIRMDRWLDRTR